MTSASLYPYPVNGCCAKCDGALQAVNREEGRHWRCLSCGWIHEDPAHLRAPPPAPPSAEPPTTDPTGDRVSRAAAVLVPPLPEDDAERRREVERRANLVAEILFPAPVRAPPSAEEAATATRACPECDGTGGCDQDQFCGSTGRAPAAPPADAPRAYHPTHMGGPLPAGSEDVRAAFAPVLSTMAPPADAGATAKTDADRLIAYFSERDAVLTAKAYAMGKKDAEDAAEIRAREYWEALGDMLHIAESHPDLGPNMRAALARARSLSRRTR
jgi:hypothetical protein